MDVPCWSGLHPDLLEQVAAKLSEIEDFTAFRGVCTSWRGAATKDLFVSVSKIPLLMFQGKEAGDSDVCEFYSWRKRKILSRITVPEAKGKRCTGVGFGWILTVSFSGGELNLVNPMFSAKIQLPNMMTFPGYEDYYTEPEQDFAAKAVLSANPSQTSDFVLMGVASSSLGFWRNGDNNWTKIEMIATCCDRHARDFENICFYKHKLYAIDFPDVWVWDPYLTQTPEIILSINPRWYTKRQYLVESSKGELLLILRDGEKPWESFRTVQIDTVNREYGLINNLDQDAIFIGQNSAVSVAADDFPGLVKANCIYFTDNGTDMRIYNVEDRSLDFERLGLDADSSSSERPPIII